jgi:YVTN family beta-propeller protein
MIGGIPTYSSGVGWLAYAPWAKSVYVAAPPGSLDLIGVANMTTYAVIQVGSEPFGVAVDPSLREVFVTNSGSDNVTVINGTTQKLVASIPVGTSPEGIAYDPTDDRVYVANNGSNNLSVIRASTNRMIASLPMASGPAGVAWDPASDRVFVTDRAADQVTVVNASTDKGVGNVSVGSTPFGIADDNATGNLYAANEGSNNVSVISARTASLNATVPVLGTGFLPALQGVAYDSAHRAIWVTAGATAVLINTSVERVSGEIPYDPAGIAYDSDNGQVCVTNAANRTFGCFDFQWVERDVNVTFSESGLPRGTPWNVTVGSLWGPRGNVTQIGTGSSIVFGVDDNSRYLNISFTVGRVLGYTANPAGGYVRSTSGGDTSVGVIFAMKGQYAVSFQETGLPSGTNWSVSLGGSLQSSVEPVIGFSESNGTYAFLVGAVAGWTTSSTRGTVTVNGAAVQETIPWSEYVLTIPVGPGPELPIFDPANGYVYVSNGGSSADNMSVIQGTSVLASVQFPSSPLPGVVDTVNGNIFVPLPSSNEVAVVNGTSIVGFVHVGTELYLTGASFDPIDGYVYDTATNASDGVGEVLVINGTSVLASVQVGQGAIAPVFDSANGYLYVANLYSGTVSVIGGGARNGSLAGLSVLATLTVGESGVGPTDPDSAVVDPTNGYVYVVNQQPGFNEGSVSVIDGTAVAATIWLAEDSYGYQPTYAFWDPANTNVYVLTGAYPRVGSYRPAVEVIHDVSLVGNISIPPLGTQTISATVDPANGFLYVSNSSGGYNEWVVNGTHVVGSVAVGLNPQNGVFDPDNGFLYIPSGVGNVSVINGSGRFPVILSFIADPAPLEIGSVSRGSTELDVSAIAGVGALTYAFTGLPEGCSTSNTPSLRCAPAEAGNFSVRVSVNDSSGNSVTGAVFLLVAPHLTCLAFGSRSSVDIPAAVSFGSAVTGGIWPYAYAWAFGDGTTSTLRNPTHAYTSPGLFTAHVWVNDSAGVSASSAVQTVVYPRLQLALTVSNATPILGQAIEINATPSGGTGRYSFAYDGLPPGCVSVDLPTIGCLPTQAGRYNINATATDSNGGSATAFLALQIVFGFTVVAPSSAVVGQPITIDVQIAQGAGQVDYTYANLPSGCASANTPLLTCTPTAVGLFGVTITAVSSIYGVAHQVVNIRIVGSGGPGATGPFSPPEVVAIGAVIAIASAVVGVVWWRRKQTASTSTLPSTPPGAPST